MEAAINESLKNVCKVKEIVKTFLEMRQMDNEALLHLAVELLEKTEDILAEGV